MAFHNPYHFVPVKNGARHDDLSRENFKAGRTHATHDRHVAGTYSGRVVCRLTTEDSIFVGACRAREATETAPAVVLPFELDGRPAIPATTLRGLISGILEAASNSALRVLENETYSYRKTMDTNAPARDRPLSAIGMIVKEGESFRLRPLTLPVMQAVRLPVEYDGLYAEPNLKVYIGDRFSIRDVTQFPFETFTTDRREFYYMKLYLDAGGNRRQWDANGELPNDARQYWKNNNFLLAQTPVAAGNPKRLEEIPPGELHLYTRGILRVLGCEGRDDIPTTKKHEIFIPYPVGAEIWPTFEILPEAIARFEQLADQRTEARKEDSTVPPLPYEPRGTERNRLSPDHKDHRCFRLKDGDLVYFRPSATKLKKIAEISLSSIWRDRVEDGQDGARRAATAFSFFKQVDPELLPFNQSRTVVTLAEQMFGFVEEKESRAESGEDAEREFLALAGRLYPSSARLIGIRDATGANWEANNQGLDEPYTITSDDWDAWPTLKILSSPKPPSPAMYFKNANGQGGYIAKRQLNPARHHPQGRKFYLHHRAHDNQTPWVTANPDENCKQKVKVRPVKPCAVFYFHFDFKNFTARELGALLYALRPARKFRHKVGMGKPLGLGKVCIEPVGIFRVDRATRYSVDGLFAPRYAEVWTATDESVWPFAQARTDEWPERYARELGCVEGRAPLNPAPPQIHEAFGNGINAHIRCALEMIGNPASLQASVMPPLVQVNGHRQNGEEKTYLWFVANDLGRNGNFNIEPGHRVLVESNRQHLQPLPASEQETNGQIKTLELHKLE